MLKSCLSKLSGQLSNQPMHHAVFSRHGFLRCGAMAKPLANKQSQKGFTLLEMLVVIGLMSIVALGSATLLIDEGDFKRQEDTINRWESIRKAIIGEPNLNQNGSSYASGYIADMGRLPVSVFELISKSNTVNTYDHDNNNATAEISINQPAWGTGNLNLYTAPAGYSSALNGGWRGPYLYSAGNPTYRDGWGNIDVDENRDVFNFGWNVAIFGTYPSTTSIAIQSFGLGNYAGGNESNEDFPTSLSQPILDQNEWTLSTAPISFDLKFNKPVSASANFPTLSSVPHELELRIYRYVDNGDDSITYISETSVTDDVLMIDADDTFSLVVGNEMAPSQTITPDPITPVGKFAAVIWCTHNTPTNYSDDTVFDGNCDAPNNHSPVFFSLTSSTTQVTINWNIQ